MRIAVLISGGGTTLKNLLETQQRDQLPIEFGWVVSSRDNAPGLQYARGSSIPWETISRRNFANAEDHSQTVFDGCRVRAIELVVMAGYLEHLLIPQDFENRVINIHPSLIPAFSGRGCYGIRVHRSVLEYGAKVSGCTVHFVDNEYDHGPIIAQRCCPVEPEDSPESLQARVFQQECQLYPEIIAALANNKVRLDGRRVFIDHHQQTG